VTAPAPTDAPRGNADRPPGRMGDGASPDAPSRAWDGVWDVLLAEVAHFPAAVRELPVVPAPADASAAGLRAWLAAAYPFDAPVPLEVATGDVMRHLRAGTVHVTSPRYFGLFNPSVREAGVVADALAALYNPQLAAWSHAPAACAIERHTLGQLARLLGWDPNPAHATFTTGGAESNLSALLAALSHHCPTWDTGGVAGLGARPAVYLSAEGHHSFVKIARMTGLGTDALRLVPTTARLTLDPGALAARMDADRAAGWHPLLVVGTAGTTGAGAVDPLAAIAEVAAARGAWFHVDAAWGGLAAFVPRLRPLLAGVERADSVTWDAHKGLSVPMGAGMFFCRHSAAAARAFAVSTSYMPPSVPSGMPDPVGGDAAEGPGPDPYATTAQWSRRAIGLKVFLALAELGVDGYGALLDHQARVADTLRDRLRAAGWFVVNDTPLPVVCFTHPEIQAGRLTTGDLLRAVYARGRVWPSDVVLGGAAEGARGPGERVLRACVTSFRSGEGDVACLLEELGAALAAAEAGGAG